MSLCHRKVTTDSKKMINIQESIDLFRVEIIQRISNRINRITKNNKDHNRPHLNTSQDMQTVVHKASLYLQEIQYSPMC